MVIKCTTFCLCCALATVAHLQFRCLNNCLQNDRKRAVPCFGCAIFFVALFFSWFASMFYAYHEGFISGGIFALGIAPGVFLYVACLGASGQMMVSSIPDGEDYEEESDFNSFVGFVTPPANPGVNSVRVDSVWVRESSLVGYSGSTTTTPPSASPSPPFSYSSRGQDVNRSANDTRVTMTTFSEVNHDGGSNNNNEDGGPDSDQVYSSCLSIGLKDDQKMEGDYAYDLDGEEMNSGLPKYEDLDLPPPYEP